MTISPRSDLPELATHSTGPPSSRLDVAVVARGLLPSRAKAQDAIASGDVTVNGSVFKKAAAQVSQSDLLSLTVMPRYVSRGGAKLEAALAHFQIEAESKRCLDVGASTGGFTDCLLQHGAADVTAIDAGSGQMTSATAGDPRVTVRENINARYLGETDIVGPFDLITVDVSFISLTLVLAPLLSVLAQGGDLITLIKPQFEVGRENLGGRGVVKSPVLWRDAVDKVTACAKALGITRAGLMESPISGGDGNIEFLAHFTRTQQLYP